MEMEAVMLMAQNSGIKDKAKLREYLYKNPKKLALKLAKMLQEKDGNLLQPIKFKGHGTIFCYSYNDKRFIPCPRNGEYYLLPWVDESGDRCYVYSHYSWSIGVILRVFKDQIEELGFN